MDEQTARILLYAITAAAIIAWLAGLQTLASALRARRTINEPFGKFAIEEVQSGDQIVGEVEVDGAPADLSARAASVLVRNLVPILRNASVLQQAPAQLEFAYHGSETGPPQRGRLQFAARSGNRTQVAYAVEVPRNLGLLWAGFAVQAVGLLVVIVLFVVMQQFVVSSPNPAIRWQVLQMLQVVHPLWPPFLLAYLYRQSGRNLRVAIDSLVRNLPYYPES